MLKTLSVLFVVLAIASPAFAADDGGFGSAKFPEAAPAALGDFVAGDISSNPAAIEPAAGDEEDVTPAEEKLVDDAANPASAVNAASAPVLETPKSKDAPKE